MPGTLVMALAGGQADIEFDFVNDSPDVAAYTLRVEGNPVASWAKGVGDDFAVYATPSGNGILRLLLNPPTGTPSGQYPFQVKILSSGMMVGDGPIKLILEVVGVVATSTPDPLPEQNSPLDIPATPAPPASQHPLSNIQPANPAGAGVSNANLAGANLAGSRLPDPNVSAPRPSVPAPPVANNVAATGTGVAGQTSTGAKSVLKNIRGVPTTETTPPLSTGSGTQPAQAVGRSGAASPATPQVATPGAATSQTSTPLATSVAPRDSHEEQFTIVDLLPEDRSSSGDPTPSDANSPPSIPTEPAEIDPPNGKILSLKPGEKLLLRFPFTNNSRATRTYLLNETLASDWRDLVVDKVNLTASGTGELLMRLKPPLNARPGEYPFDVTVGPFGEITEPRMLTLNVLPTPAVKLTAKQNKTTASGGPFSRFLDFSLLVEAAGNSDTAFRLAVKPPEEKEPTTSVGTGPPRYYDTPEWRFLFDRELGDLRAVGSQQAPPVEIRLRVQRKGNWWWSWGLTEQLPLKVEAVPVTDITNGGKAGNVVDLTAKRTKIPVPVPLLALFLCMFFFLLSGSPSDLSVTNAIFNIPGKPEYYVVNPPLKAGSTAAEKSSVPIALSWDASFYATLKVLKIPLESGKVVRGFTLGSGSVEVESDKTNITDFIVDQSFHVERWIGGGGLDVNAHAVHTRSGEPLLVQGATPTTSAPGVQEVTLVVPQRGWKGISLKNGAPASQADLNLRLKLVVDLAPDAPFEMKQKIVTSTLHPQESTTANEFLFRRREGVQASDATAQMVVICSDADHPLLKINLRSTPLDPSKEGGR